MNEKSSDSSIQLGLEASHTPPRRVALGVDPGDGPLRVDPTVEALEWTLEIGAPEVWSKVGPHSGYESK